MRRFLRNESYLKTMFCVDAMDSNRKGMPNETPSIRRDGVGGNEPPFGGKCMF